MKTIFNELLYAMEKQQDTVLVTIVQEDGSVPRGTGSQMLVGSKGRLQGTVGGGAVEQCSMEMARELLPQKKCLMHQFLLRKNNSEDIGMVCGGDVTVWFQFIGWNDPLWQDLARKVLAQMEAHEGGWLIFNMKTGVPSLAGEDGALLAGDDFAFEMLVHQHMGKRIGDCFSLPVPSGEKVYVFGAGHIARALVPLLSTVGFRSIVFDCRPEYAVAADFPDAEQVICGDYEKISDYIDVKPEDYIVVMTNGHSHDYSVQNQLLRTEFAYMGVIGSSRKTAAVNARLMAAGISEEATRRVHTPIGTKIKAVTPAEIAVSIAGEMICVRAERREKGEEVHAACPMH